MAFQNDFTRARGRVLITTTDSINNVVKEKQYIDNLVVDIGLEYIISRMLNTDNSIMSHMAIGAGNTETNAGSFTDLESMLGSRNPLVSTNIVDQDSDGVMNSIRYNAQWLAGDATGSVVEAGIFNDGTAAQGIMLARTVFPVVNKEPNDILSIEWTVTLEPDTTT